MLPNNLFQPHFKMLLENRQKWSCAIWFFEKYKTKPKNIPCEEKIFILFLFESLKWIFEIRPTLSGGELHILWSFFQKKFFEVGQLHAPLDTIFQKKKTLKMSKKKWYSQKWAKKIRKKWNFSRKNEVGNFKTFLG